MGILKIVNIVLKISQKLTEYFARKQLIDAGSAKEKSENLEVARDAVSKAIDARRVARRKFKSDGMPSDYEHFRD